MNTGSMLFTQVMNYVPWKTFLRIIDDCHGDRGTRTLSCAELFRIMAFAQLTYRESLRDVEICLKANCTKLFRMGLRHAPARSTIADALNGRDWKIYHMLAMNLIKRAQKLYCNDTPIECIKDPIYALDASTIQLCLSIFDWASFRKTKAAIKLHTLLDLRGNIPSFIHISDGKMADVRVLDILEVEPASFYVMDRAYVDFKRLYKMHQMGAFFVTRAKKNMLFQRIYSAKVERSSGLICDQTIRLTGRQSSQTYPCQLRRIRYHDSTTGKKFVFLTNNMTLSALIIALLYKNRWQVELFFKWIKQHLKIKHFLGRTENAVKLQIWAAVSTYLIIAIIKKELKIEASLYTFLQILSVSIFEKIPILRAFQEPDYKSNDLMPYNQLNLFDF